MINGEVEVLATPSLWHQEVLGRLWLAFREASHRGRLGRVILAPMDVVLTEQRVLQPDLLVVRRDRFAILGTNAVHGAPDIVVEILSPSTRARDEGVKARLYEQAGVPEPWIVDPDGPAVRRFALTDGYDVEVASQDGKPRSAVLPDLLVDPAELFADV